MSIQWYPGHMHKADKEMAAALPDVDVVIEVIDARLPFSSSNPALDTRIRTLPRLRIMTRADLADPELTKTWLTALADAGQTAIAIRTDDVDRVRRVPEQLRELLPSNPDGRVAPRIGPRTVMVAGIPNVGKSTLINRLAGRTIAKTGNEPAVTKRQQTVPIGEGWVLRDTPGVMWPKVENPASGFRLAASGAIRDTAMDSGEVAAELLDYLRLAYPTLLCARYGEALPLHESVATLEAIGQSRGCLGGGGLVDFDRAGRLLLTEFRQGTLGRITLETPAMRDAELIETEARRARIEAKRLARRESRRDLRRARSRKGHS